MPIEDVLKAMTSTIVGGVALSFVGSIALSVFLSGPVSGFFGRRGVATELAGYVGVAPKQINLQYAGWVKSMVLPRGGYVCVPVSISDKNQLKNALTAYYRHPEGVGSEEALHDFFTTPEVAGYLTQPVSRLDRMMQVF